MNGKNEFVRTWFGLVGRHEIEKIKEKLEKQKSKLETQIEDCSFVIENWEKRSITDIERILWDICMTYEDCTNCIAFDFCRFAEKGCTEVYYCEGCPRLRICVRNASKGFVQYVRDSKLGGGFE